MSELEALEAVCILRLLPDDVHDRVDQLRPLSVVTLGPVVAWNMEQTVNNVRV